MVTIHLEYVHEADREREALRADVREAQRSFWDAALSLQQLATTLPPAEEPGDVADECWRMLDALSLEIFGLGDICGRFAKRLG